jgi:drug/metabolite transporter (DMT)-like permease
MSRIFGFLALSLAAILWGSSFIAGKIALQSFSFPALVIIRFLISGFLLSAWFLYKKVPLKEAFSPRLLLLGFLTVTATFLLEFAGLSLTSAVNASGVLGLEPMVVPLVGALFFKERFPLPLALLSVLSVVGTWLTVGTVTPQGWWGILLVFVATFVIGFCIFLTKRLMTANEPIVATGLVTWGGLSSLIPASLLLIPVTGTPVTTNSACLLESILAVIFLGIFCSFGADFLWNWGLKRVSGGFSGIFLAFEPLVGVLLAIILLKDAFTWQIGVGMALVLLAAMIAVFLEKKILSS